MVTLQVNLKITKSISLIRWKMKKLFQFVGLITLLFFSFYLNSTTKNVIKNMDDIMMQIKMNKNKYNRDRVDAIIIDKYIIPGISKKTVDENKSYENMRKYGKYDEDYYDNDLMERVFVRIC